MADELYEALARAAIFGGIPTKSLRWLAARARRRTFRTGAVLMRQGEAVQSIHVLQQGRVELQRVHPDLLEPIILAELWPGEVVGEVGVLDDGSCRATVVALEDTVTLELERETLREFAQQHPAHSTTFLHVLRG